MLRDMHVTSMRGFGCRRFPPSPSELVASLLPPQDRGWGRRSAKQQPLSHEMTRESQLPLYKESTLLTLLLVV